MSYEVNIDQEDERLKEKMRLELEEKRDELKEKRDQDRKRRLGILKKIAKQLRSKKQNVSNEDWDRILRVKDLHLFIFSLIGLLASIFLSYFKWSQRCYLEQPPGDIPHCVYDPDGAYGRAHPDETRVTATIENTEKNMSSTWVIMLTAQFVMSFSTSICVVLLVQYYRLRLTERRREWSGLEELDLIEGAGNDGGDNKKKKQFIASYNFAQSSLRLEFAAEALLHLIHPILWIEVLDDPNSTAKPWQTAYEVFECIIFLRLYLLLRLLYINSNTYIFRADIVNSNKELQRYGYRVTASSTYKIMFYNNPGIMVAFLSSISIAVFGFWMFVIERNGNPQFEQLWDCYWFVWVSISTIGYGDMSATSVTGRSIVIIIAVASLFIMTIFSGIVTNLLAPTKEQKYVTGFLDQQEADVEYKKAAVNLIVVVHREKKERLKNRTYHAYGGKRSPDVYRAIKRLRSARLAMRNSFGSAADPVVDIKLQRAVVMAHRLNDLLDKQAEKIVKLEDHITTATNVIKQRGTLRRRAHSPAGAASSSRRVARAS